MLVTKHRRVIEGVFCVSVSLERTAIYGFSLSALTLRGFDGSEQGYRCPHHAPADFMRSNYVLNKSLHKAFFLYGNND